MADFEQRSAETVADGSQGGYSETAYVSRIVDAVVASVASVPSMQERVAIADAEGVDEAMEVANGVLNAHGEDRVFGWHPDYPGSVMLAPVEWFE